MAMYDCRGKCLCANCKRIKRNCAECIHSVKKTKECLEAGIKECKYFLESEDK